MSEAVEIRRLLKPTDAEIQGLADVLIDCVDGGASVLAPALFTAEDAQRILGTVQLLFDLPENQPHRADLSKMLVHRRARRRGVGKALLHAAENFARENGKRLLVLDTASGDAERLYARGGWIRVGVVPGFALWPEGGLCDTTFFYRRLEPLPA